jgi:hypothetical protein
MNDRFEKWPRVKPDEVCGDTRFIMVDQVVGMQSRQVTGLDEVVRQALDQARELLEKTAREGKDFMPMAFVYCPLAGERPHVNVCLIAEGFSGYEGKRRVGAGLAQWAAKHQAAAIVLCTDGWALRSPERLAGNEAAISRWLRAAGPPSEHPDRVEVLNVSCIYPDATATGTVMQYKRVKRDGDGEDIAWGEKHECDGGEGRQEQSLIPAWSKGAVV